MIVEKYVLSILTTCEININMPMEVSGRNLEKSSL